MPRVPLTRAEDCTPEPRPPAQGDWGQDERGGEAPLGGAGAAAALARMTVGFGGLRAVPGLTLVVEGVRLSGLVACDDLDNKKKRG